MGFEPGRIDSVIDNEASASPLFQITRQNRNLGNGQRRPAVEFSFCQISIFTSYLKKRLLIFLV